MKMIRMAKAEAVEAETTLAEAMRTSDVRWELVAELRAKIARGQYRISSDALAGRLMEVMLQRPVGGAAFSG